MIGPISDYDAWRLASPYEGREEDPNPKWWEDEEFYDDDDDEFYDDDDEEFDDE